MKKWLFALLTMSTLLLGAAEVLKYGNHDVIQFKSGAFTVFKNGPMTMSFNGLYASMYAPLKTSEGWAKNNSTATFDDTQKNQIVYQNSFPEKGVNPVKYTQKVEVTDNGEVVIRYGAESAFRKNIQEFFFRVELPMKKYAGNEIEVNGQKFKVENITKFGWFRKTATEPEVVFFKDGKPVYRFKSKAKMHMVGEASKDGTVGLRFYCAEGTSGELTVSFN